jgi:hypothetical protein
MNRVVTYTPVGLKEADESTPRKKPLTELVRAANGGREPNPRTAHLTLEAIRAKLVNTDSLDAFEAADENKGIFGWLDRRRKASPEVVARPNDSFTILTTATVFASSRR